MRIVRWSGLAAVVLVKGRGVCTVAVPENLASREVLELARLVLSPNEYQELQLEVKPAEGEDPEVLRLVGRRRRRPLRGAAHRARRSRC